MPRERGSFRSVRRPARPARGGGRHLHRLIRRPSPATIISLTALFVALGGTSYAAVALAPRNSVGSAQVINGSLLKKDLSSKTVAALKGNRGPAGTAGTAGAAGPAGPAGGAGPAGATGLAGATGAVGASGPAGASGAVGASGPAGPDSFAYAKPSSTPRSRTRAVVEPSVLILVRCDSRPGDEKGPVTLTGPFHLAGGLGFEPR